MPSTPHRQLLSPAQALPSASTSVHCTYAGRSRLYSSALCRWQVRQSEQGEWEVQVVATSRVEPGEEALFSYGARSQSSAYFMLHYGFV